LLAAITCCNRALIIFEKAKYKKLIKYDTTTSRIGKMYQYNILPTNRIVNKKINEYSKLAMIIAK